jgi:hypothetical protein
MRSILVRVGVVCLCAAAGTALAQDAGVYKWVDANGTVNYGDQPPAGTAAEALPIRSRRSTASAAGRSSRPMDSSATVTAAAATDNDAGDTADEGDPADPASAVGDDERDQLLAQRQNNCKLAKQRMASYEQARRIYRPGPGGERVYLTDDELDAERATARVAVAEWCDE